VGRPVCRIECTMHPDVKERLESFAAEQQRNQNAIVLAALEYYFHALDDMRTPTVEALREPLQIYPGDLNTENTSGASTSRVLRGTVV